MPNALISEAHLDIEIPTITDRVGRSEQEVLQKMYESTYVWISL